MSCSAPNADRQLDAIKADRIISETEFQSNELSQFARTKVHKARLRNDLG